MANPPPGEWNALPTQVQAQRPVALFGECLIGIEGEDEPVRVLVHIYLLDDGFVPRDIEARVRQRAVLRVVADRPQGRVDVRGRERRAPDFGASAQIRRGTFAWHRGDDRVALGACQPLNRSAIVGERDDDFQREPHIGCGYDIFGGGGHHAGDGEVGISFDSDPLIAERVPIDTVRVLDVIEICI